jgi:monoamine oxidase
MPDVGPEAAEIDAVSVREYLDTAGGDPQFQMVNEVFWGVNCHARCADVSAASAFAWYAWAGFDSMLAAENLYTFKPEGGMRRLMQAIAGDGQAEIRFAARVVAIEQTSTNVTVTLEGGEALVARTAVLATPLNTWTSIAFDPALSDRKQQLATQRHAGHGVKVAIRVAGRHDVNVALPEPYPLMWIQPEYLDDDQTIFVAFGQDGSALPATDEPAVAAALDEALPGLEVLEVIGHDWVGDDLANGTWAMFRPGQLTRLVPAARAPERRVAFAGADISRGWISLVDGGIESGLTAAVTTRQTLDR